MGTHQDAVQRAVVLGAAVVDTLVHGAFNALICVTVHAKFLLLLVSFLLCLGKMNLYPAGQRKSLLFFEKYGTLKEKRQEIQHGIYCPFYFSR